MAHLLNTLYSVADATVTFNQIKLNKHYIFVISMFFSKHPHGLEFMDNSREEMLMNRPKGRPKMPISRMNSYKMN